MACNRHDEAGMPATRHIREGARTGALIGASAAGAAVAHDEVFDGVLLAPVVLINHLHRDDAAYVGNLATVDHLGDIQIHRILVLLNLLMTLTACQSGCFASRGHARKTSQSHKSQRFHLQFTYRTQLNSGTSTDP